MRWKVEQENSWPSPLRLELRVTEIVSRSKNNPFPKRNSEKTTRQCLLRPPPPRQTWPRCSQRCGQCKERTNHTSSGSLPISREKKIRLEILSKCLFFIKVMRCFFLLLLLANLLFPTNTRFFPRSLPPDHNIRPVVLGELLLDPESGLLSAFVEREGVSAVATEGAAKRLGMEIKSEPFRWKVRGKNTFDDFCWFSYRVHMKNMFFCPFSQLDQPLRLLLPVCRWPDRRRLLRFGRGRGRRKRHCRSPARPHSGAKGAGGKKNSHHFFYFSMPNVWFVGGRSHGHTAPTQFEARMISKWSFIAVKSRKTKIQQWEGTLILSQSSHHAPVLQDGIVVLELEHVRHAQHKFLWRFGLTAAGCVVLRSQGFHRALEGIFRSCSEKNIVW